MEKKLYAYLEELGIATETYEHEPLYTVEQALAATAHIPGTQCKNLFLKDSKGNYYLVVAVHDTKIPLKKLSKDIGAPELRFTDAALLREYLQVEPGSVTPFGLIHTSAKTVNVILDSRLFEAELVDFHPLRNSATTVLNPQGLKKFIEACGNTMRVVDFLLYV